MNLNDGKGLYRMVSDNFSVGKNDVDDADGLRFALWIALCIFLVIVRFLGGMGMYVAYSPSYAGSILESRKSFL